MHRRFHLPTAVSWPVEASGLDRPALEQAILDALARAVMHAAGGGAEIVPVESTTLARERFDSARAGGRGGSYRVPSYDQGGAPTEVPLRSGAEVTRFGDDQVVAGDSPFEGRLVVILPGWRSVEVRSSRYVVSSNLVHAVAWGELLFGTRSFVVLEHLRSHKLFTASTNETVRWDELRTRPVGEVEGHALFGSTEGNYYWVPVVDDLEGEPHALRALVTVEGHSVFPPSTALAREYFAQYQRDLAKGRRLDPSAVRRFLFDEIDRLIKEDRTEEAAARLAQLDANAFGLVAWAEKAAYLKVLVDAWTWEAQERAIVEVFKSMRSVTEVRAALEILKEKGRYGQLFHDLDSQLWSLLATVGQLDPQPFTVQRLGDLMVEAGLVPSVTTAARFALGPAGVAVGQNVLDEAEEAARSFVRFLGDTVESLWMFLSHPEKVVEGVGQLVRLAIAVQLAQWGHRPSQQLIASTVGQAAKHVATVLRGAEILGVVDRVMRRIKWAIIWEVASLFVGVGEVKAVLSSVKVSELTLLLTRLARVLGIVGEAAEGSRALRNLERIAAALAKANPALGSAEDVLRLMSRLPEEDVRRLSRILETVELEEGIDLARLANAHPQLGEIATDLRARSEALSALASKAGGLTDEVAEAFGRLSSSGLTPAEIRGIADAIPAGEGGHFLATLRRIPAALLTSDRAATRDLLTLLARSPRAMDAVVNEGFVLVSALHRRVGGRADRLEEYLSALHQLRDGLPAERRATEYRQLLDALEAGDTSAWIRLESTRRVAVGRPGLQGLEAAIAGNVRAESGFQRLLRGGHHRLLDEVVEDILPHNPQHAAEILGHVGSLTDEQARGLAILHRISDELPSAVTWGDVLYLTGSHRGELLELIARVHPSLDETEGLARVVGRTLSGPGTNVQGTLGHLHAARTLQQRFPGARMRFEIGIPGREVDIRLTTAGRTIDVEVKTLLNPTPNPQQIRHDLIRHLDDRFENLMYLFEPGGGSLDPVRTGMLDALSHPDVLTVMAAKGITPAMAQTWLQQRLAGDLLGVFQFL